MTITRAEFLGRLFSRIASLFGLEVIKVNARKVRTGQFCDYCTCEGCRLLCVDASVFCKDHPDCRHKPKLAEVAK